LTGKGVVFGILETEFDTHHPAFLDSLGRTRFAAIWDETDTTKPSNVPATYGGYGQIKKGSALNDDSLFATNGFYHGTIVTSFGAGSDRAHPWWGAAPEAVIVGVKYGDADADIVNGLKWIFAMSDSMKMPCVVNMSIGTQLGPHDGTSAVDRTVDALSGVGTSGLAHIVVGAAGNDAEHKCHVSFPLKPGETRGTWIMPNATGNPTMALNVVTFVDVWGGVNKSFTDTVYVYDTSVSPMQYKKTSTIRPNQAPDTTLWPNAATGKSDTLVFQIFSERNSVNQKQHIEMVAQGNNPSMIVGLRIAAVQAETVHVWNVEQVTFKSLGVAGFYDGDSLYTIAEVGGTSKTIITAGGYNSKVDLTTWNDTVYGKGDSSLHNYLSYSSLGPTADGRIKPDISAPARFVVGAMSRVGKDDNRTVLWPNPANTLGRYEFTGGTSVASPIVAGIVALMLEANHALTPANARQILQQTAINDAFTGNITTPDVRWGAGKVNALDAVKQLGIPVISIRPSKGASPCDEFNIVKTGRNRLLLKGPVDGKHQEARIELFDLSGRMLLGIHAKTGSAFSIPKAAELRFMIVRVRLPGGASFTQMLSVM
jgi:subtilisin family serine protease